MKNIDVIKFLLDEVDDEINRLKAFQIYEKKYYLARKENKAVRWEWKGNIPRKSLILQNMRKIRQLSLQVISEAIK